MSRIAAVADVVRGVAPKSSAEPELMIGSGHLALGLTIPPAVLARADEIIE